MFSLSSSPNKMSTYTAFTHADTCVCTQTHRGHRHSLPLWGMWLWTSLSPCRYAKGECSMCWLQGSHERSRPPREKPGLRADAISISLDLQAIHAGNQGAWAEQPQKHTERIMQICSSGSLQASFSCKLQNLLQWHVDFLLWTSGSQDKLSLM